MSNYVEKLSKLFLIRNELQKSILGLRNDSNIINEQENREIMISYGEYISMTHQYYPEYIFGEFKPDVFEKCLSYQKNGSFLEAEKYYQKNNKKLIKR